MLPDFGAVVPLKAAALGLTVAPDGVVLGLPVIDVVAEAVAEAEAVAGLHGAGVAAGVAVADAVADAVGHGLRVGDADAVPDGVGVVPTK